MKVIGLYLPQYHRIRENDKWWGDGYTEWVAVKKAKPLFKNHYQPRIPLNNNYYDLVKDGIETWKWQAELINKYNIYGLCIYHYWFNGKLLLEKPMEILLANKNINIRYSICWANEPWSRTWEAKPKESLIEQNYGGMQDIENHFNYLLPFFLDSRYIKINNKPLVHLYRSSNITYLTEMMEIWNKMAIDNGFEGIYWISAITSENNDNRKNLFDHYYYFEPGYTLKYDFGLYNRTEYLLKVLFRRFRNMIYSNGIEKFVNINKLWKRIEERDSDDMISPGTLTGWDNTPRKKENGTVFYGDEKNFEKHIRTIFDKYGDDEFLYVNAWNEWSEGAYLEPDERNKFYFLECILKASKNKAEK